MSPVALARRLLSALEPVAVAPWFSPDWLEEMTAAGFPGWAGYFCSRAAPLGPIPADAGVALFYNWNPAMIRRELRWDGGTPQQARDAFVDGARRTFERLLPDKPDVARAAALLREAAAAAPREGRAVFAAYAALPSPEEPMLALWHGAMTLREFRGDTHNAILVSHGITPVEALVLNAAFIRADLLRYLASREWTLDDAKPAIEHLTRRAFLDDAGALTDGGGKFREMIELDTDRRSTAPIEALGEPAVEEALALIEPLGARIHEAKAVPGLVRRVGGASR